MIMTTKHNILRLHYILHYKTINANINKIYDGVTKKLLLTSKLKATSTWCFKFLNILKWRKKRNQHDQQFYLFEQELRMNDAEL